jgi:hypothetical protein
MCAQATLDMSKRSKRHNASRSRDETQDEQATDLPDRMAMSLVGLTAIGDPLPPTDGVPPFHVVDQPQPELPPVEGIEPPVNTIEPQNWLLHSSVAARRC